MNLMQRILRLPLVVSSTTVQPIINTGLLVLGILGVAKKNAQLHPLPAHQPITDTSPVKIIMYCVDIYKNLRDSSPDNEVVWLAKNTLLVFKNITTMIFASRSNNSINELPHLLAGKVDSRHLVPNTPGKVYVVALSEGMVASLGFISLLFFKVITYIFFAFLLNRTIKWIYRKFISITQISKDNKKTIDISSRNLNSEIDRVKHQEPIYLRKYIENRNAE